MSLGVTHLIWPMWDTSKMEALLRVCWCSARHRQAYARQPSHGVALSTAWGCSVLDGVAYTGSLKVILNEEGPMAHSPLMMPPHSVSYSTGSSYPAKGTICQNEDM